MREGCRRGGEYRNLIGNTLRVQVHQHSCLGLSDTRLVPFHDPAHEFFAGVGEHSHTVIGVLGVSGRVRFEGPSPDVGVERFSCM